ncbi:hypothetical protein L596_005848 [Steinernema carpocapsae]|uniref:Uncharacterized protein n=1 Tax=Steinernema carpocapsae TaxID=34508 RepID=A0A4U8V0C4_STECR|nr:hypothetical protein L596_005848 [Steinernema carpocapsae]
MRTNHRDKTETTLDQTTTLRLRLRQTNRHPSLILRIEQKRALNHWFVAIFLSSVKPRECSFAICRPRKIVVKQFVPHTRAFTLNRNPAQKAQSMPPPQYDVQKIHKLIERRWETV